ncbi:D-alanyl-D-alanine carboxypeptidase/D-alanyl-D-alanine-endopeptidase [Modestobacter sp. L9-4]|nr:D-alanyl-D-alanine carboxypeptidase/D-alanyl-D-alanine-endopeptidase [Modestobacter sp. L9-4]
MVGATAAPVRGRRRARAGSRGGRLAKVLVAAVLAVALLAGGVWLALDRTGGRDAGPAAPQAEQVPDAVLPALTDPQPVLAELAGTAPVPDPGVLSATLAPLLAAPALGSGLSAQVVDVATGQVLLDRDAADPGTPASTNKLLTSLAVLTTLDPTDTIATTVVAGSTPGEVVLVGGGDPTLSTTAPSTDYPGAATVADLADQVRTALGGTPVTRVVVDGSLFTGPETAPAWGPGDAPSTYAAPVTAVAVDGARVRPGRDPRSGRPAADAGAALAAALGAPGVPVAAGVAPAGARTLGRVESAPVSRLVEQALNASDNLLAEDLARQVALRRGLPAGFDGAAQAVTAALGEAGLDTTGVSLTDGSGLAADDRVPARLLVDVLRGAADGSIPGVGALLSGLPVAGYDGTLADRAADGTGAPAAVRAKTGTLGGVNDLAGTVLTADGRLLAFAVLADGTTGGPVASEAALDRVAAALAGCGCR